MKWQLTYIAFQFGDLLFIIRFTSERTWVEIESSLHRPYHSSPKWCMVGMSRAKIILEISDMAYCCTVLQHFILLNAISLRPVHHSCSYQSHACTLLYAWSFNNKSDCSPLLSTFYNVPMSVVSCPSLAAVVVSSNLCEKENDAIIIWRKGYFHLKMALLIDRQMHVQVCTKFLCEVFTNWRNRKYRGHPLLILQHTFWTSPMYSFLL